MSDAVLIFTFSPIQPFIAESRRAADLYAGSQILVELSKAAANSIGQDRLVFPATLADDVPNRIVAHPLPYDDCEQIAFAARDALLERWHDEIASEARKRFEKRMKSSDRIWNKIWGRQTGDDYLWEVYWAAARTEGRSYIEAYHEADRAIAAIKRTRVFSPADEQGLKDTLSGRRQALRTESLSADNYWEQAARKWVAAKLRPNGRERLDAIGLVKRFGEQADRQIGNFEGFPSTSSVASAVFLEQARKKARDVLKGYVNQLNALHLGFVNVRIDPDWSLDGDLLYMDTLTEKRLKDDFGVASINTEQLDAARDKLDELHKSAGGPPSTYYAIIVLDGDNMGMHVNACQTREEHVDFSRQLSQFAEKVPLVAQEYQGFVIFNGGDDVLVMAPLATAYKLARRLANEFHQITGGTASAGIAVTHHQSPLSAALREARQAERQAKQIDADKAAVCVIAMKRSGEAVEMRSKWEVAGSILSDLVDLLKDEGDQGSALATGFVYDVGRSIYALPQADEKLEAELRRLLKRHSNEQHTNKPDPTLWAVRLKDWAACIPGGADELRNWLVFARFISQGGGE